MKLFGKQLETLVDNLASTLEDDVTVKTLLQAVLDHCREHGMHCDAGEARRAVMAKLGSPGLFDKLVAQKLK
jgi:predicted outer membrane protein